MHKNLFYYKFIIFLYMFRALCAYHQEVKIVLYSIVYHHTCRWPSGAQVGGGYNKFIINLYMFQALCAHHQEVRNVLHTSGIITPVGGRPVHKLGEDIINLL